MRRLGFAGYRPASDRWPVSLAFNNLSQNAAGIADGQAVRWNIMHNYAPGPNHTVITNRHAGTDDAASTKPDIVADSDWFCCL